MLDHPHTEESSTNAPAWPPDVTERPWSAEVEDLLVRAAALCAANDVDPESFMHAAWAANLEARPGLREKLADQELMARVEDLRKHGLVGDA